MNSINNRGWYIKFSSKDRRKRFVLYGLYILSICLAYIWILSPIYAYSHLTYHPNNIKLIISVTLIIISLIFIPSDERKPSTFLFYIFYSLTYIPTATYYWLNDQPTLYIVYETICFILISVLIRRNGRPILISTTKAKVLIQIIFCIYVLACIILVFHNGGIHINAILSDLYSVRGENNLSGLFGYFLNWCAKSFMPLFFVYFFIQRKWYGVVLTCVLQMLLFVSYGFKAYIVAVVLLIGVSALMRFPERFMSRWILILSTGNILSSICAKYINGMPITLFSYRTLILPAQGQFEYYDFFTHHDYLYFSEGSIGKIFGIPYPYSESIGRVVNSYIFGGAKISNGNTGAFSYGFADLGFAGMILAALAIGVIFIIIDASTKKLPKLITVGAMAYQMFTLNDNNVLICINTGGIFWTIIMLILLNSIYINLVDEKISFLMSNEKEVD